MLDGHVVAAGTKYKFTQKYHTKFVNTGVENDHGWRLKLFGDSQQQQQQQQQ